MSKSRKKSVYFELVKAFDSAFSQFYLSVDTAPDITQIKKIAEKNKKKSHFYDEVLQFYFYLLSLSLTTKIEVGEHIEVGEIEVNPFILTGKYIEKYRQLLDELEVMLVSNLEILKAWKCLEATYFRSINDRNFSLLEGGKAAYSRSSNLNKQEALRLFNKSTSRIFQYEDLEEKSIVSAIVSAIKQTNTEKVKTSIIQPMLQVAHTALLNINSFSQTWLSFYLLTGQIVSAGPKGRRGSTRQADNCVTEFTHCRDSVFNLTLYKEDLKKSGNFLQALRQNQSIKFKFNDTYFILTEDCLTKQSLAGGEQSLCSTDYEWFLESMAIYLVEKKVEKIGQEEGLGHKNKIYPELTQIILKIDKDEYNNRKLLAISGLSLSLEDSVDKLGLEAFVLRSQFLTTRSPIFHGRIVSDQDDLISSLENSIRIRIEPMAFKANLTGRDSASTQHLFFSRTSIAPGVLVTDESTPFSQKDGNSLSSTISKVVPPIIVFGGIIATFFMVRYYIKKSKTSNSVTNIERVPLIKSVEDSLHIRRLMGYLERGLDFLKKNSRYDDEIGSKYNELCNESDKERVIIALKEFKEQLDKFSNKKNIDEKAGLQYKAVKVITESLIERYQLLRLSEREDNSPEKIDYLSETSKFKLKKVNEIITGFETIRNQFFEGGCFSSKDKERKIKYLDLLVRLDTAIYSTMLAAHINGYFEKYSRQKVLACLQTSQVVDDEDLSDPIEVLHQDLSSSIRFIGFPLNECYEEFAKSKKTRSYSDTIKNFTTILDNLSYGLTDDNARRQERHEISMEQKK